MTTTDDLRTYFEAVRDADGLPSFGDGRIHEDAPRHWSGAFAVTICIQDGIWGVLDQELDGRILASDVFNREGRRTIIHSARREV